MKRVQIILLPFLLLAVILTLPACGAGGETPHEIKEGVLTYAALNPLTKEQEQRITSFNKTHPDAQIEVLDYSDEGGKERLLTELALGWVPDIMELHCLGSRGEKRPFISSYLIDCGEQVGGMEPSEGEYWLSYRQLANKGYLEDLWPYIENDPKLGRKKLLETPMKAAEIDGSLYILFREVYITTLAGDERLVGNRTTWTWEEMMDTFSTMPEGSTILRYNYTRREMYDKLFASTLDRYIDWEMGHCSFDNDEFRTMLEFLKTFPTEFKTFLTPKEVKEEILWRKLDGEQMLEYVLVGNLADISDLDTIFGGKRVSFIGCPTVDGSSGSFLNIFGTVLAMSSACADKEAAWDFIGYLVRPVYSTKQMDNMSFWDNTIMIPVNRKSFENGNTSDMQRNKRYYEHGMYYFHGSNFDKPPLEIVQPTKEHLRRYETLIASATQLCWPDDALSDVVWDAIGPYFAGDKTMDETIQLVQNRVKLYVNENR